MALAAGNIYVADAGSVRKVSRTGFLTTPAGAGASIGPPGDGGPAVRATMETCGIAVDRSGNLVIADFANGRIRVVAATTGTFYEQAMIAQHIYTVVGGGGNQSEGGVATNSLVGEPGQVAVDGRATW